ncbi:MAG: ATP-binding cassette domain-containing protein [Verrucomicrobiae bacterium]|nr:ATP-binding cassette domain-containing protein [Verrucomicrobiae bacterium]
MFPMLKIQDLTVAYSRKGAAPAIALRGLTFDLRPGEVVALIGGVGSGKTTLLRLLAGRLPRGSEILGGRVMLVGEAESETDLLKLRSLSWRKLRRTRIATFFPRIGDHWNPERTLRQHLQEAIQLAGKTRELRSEKDWMPAFYDVGLIEPEQILGRYPGEVSALVQTRLLMAMALLTGADLWIADEATTSLDATGEDQVLRLFRELCAKHDLGLIFASADVGCIERLADRVLVLYEGGVVESGRVADLLSRPKNRYTRALLDTLPRLGERRSRLGEIDRSAVQDAMDATFGVEN